MLLSGWISILCPLPSRSRAAVSAGATAQHFGSKHARAQEQGGQPQLVGKQPAGTPKRMLVIQNNGLHASNARASPSTLRLPRTPTAQDSLRVCGQQLHGAWGAAAPAVARQLAAGRALVLICETARSRVAKAWSLMLPSWEQEVPMSHAVAMSLCLWQGIAVVAEPRPRARTFRGLGRGGGTVSALRGSPHEALLKFVLLIIKAMLLALLLFFALL